MKTELLLLGSVYWVKYSIHICELRNMAEYIQFGFDRHILHVQTISDFLLKL